MVTQIENQALPVTRAVIMEDRALVTREITLDLPGGLVEITSLPISPLIVESTLEARILSGKGQVLAATLIRQHTMAETLPERSAELLKLKRDLENKSAAATFRSNLAESQVQTVTDFCELWRDKSALQAMRGDGCEELWQKEYTSLMAAFEAKTAAATEALGILKETAASLATVTREYQEASSLRDYYSAGIKIILSLEEAGSVKLALSAIEPCIAWRPTYLARLDKGKLFLKREAAVWQYSGEDWQDIELSLSTARPGRGAELPSLPADFISLREKSEEERKVTKLTSNNRLKSSLGEEGAAALPGVADGGEVQLFTLPQKVTLLSKDSPDFYELETLEMANSIALKARPEMGSYVLLSSKQTLSALKPLLPGPVLLQRDGCYVGRLLLPYVAVGETFELDFGSEDDLLLTRNPFPVAEESVFGGKEFRFNIALTLTNRGNNLHELTLTERLPVSENAEVTVSIDEKKTSKGYTFNKEEGFLNWPLTVEPKETKALFLAFTVTTGKKVSWRP